jgi:GR25 family glycosyltransferase involved in LPS biosynthesis
MLDKRIDMWNDLKSQFAKININLQLFLCGDGSLELPYSHIDINQLPPQYVSSINYATWFSRPSAFNCWLAHRKILQKTLDENLANVLIVEDDAFIENDFEEILAHTEDFWNQNSWDMIYFGSYLSQGNWSYTSNKNILKVHNCGGWHGVLINKNVITTLLQYPPLGPFDWLCSQVIHPNYNCYAIYPSIISQKSGFSFVENSNLEKPDRYKR